MRVTFRPASVDDATALLQVKDQLRLKPDGDAKTLRGGFLLGTTLDEYRDFIEKDFVLIAYADIPPTVIGFSIALMHETLIQSTLMKRAAHVNWESPSRVNFDNKRVAYLEQLGMLPTPAYRVYAKYLAFSTVWHIFQTHDILFATVLNYPVRNIAPLSLMNVGGFECVGYLDEIYPEFGHVKSDVYCLERDVFMKKVQEPRMKTFMEQAKQRGYL